MRHYLDALLKGVVKSSSPPGDDPDDVRRWSYGDVENNGVYYHPTLTHYAHQVFEEVFYRENRLYYTDLSGRDERHVQARQGHSPPIKSRMTFPVEWLHQWMLLPMYAGDTVKTWIDTVLVARKRVGVRAWIFTESDQLAAFLVWVRAAKVLDPKPETVSIPKWFMLNERD